MSGDVNAAAGAKRKFNSQIVTAGRRHETGCIASLSDGVSRHFVGSGRDATQAAADYCDRYGLRIVCLSTPATIYRDLQGAHPVAAPREADRHGRQRFLRTPEVAMLAAIGRTDLLA